MSAGIGEAAAILQLAAQSLDLAQKACKAIHAYRAVDGELDLLRHRANTIHGLLRSYHRSLSTRYPAYRHPDVDVSLKNAFAEAKMGLEELIRFLTSLQPKQSVQEKMKWVCKRKKEAIALDTRLTRGMSDLALAMQPLEVIMNSVLLSKNEDVARAVGTLVQQSGNTSDLIAVLSDKIDKAFAQGSTHLRANYSSTFVQCVSRPNGASKTRPGRQLARTPRQLNPGWAMLGVSGSDIVTTQQYNKDSHIEFTILAGLTRLITGHALHVAINLRQFQSSPLSLQFLGGTRFDIVRTVKSDNQFLSACQRGDLDSVRWNLSTGEGRISDRDEKNWTPLAHAIASGNCDVVREILDQRADIEGKIGELQTSPLQWAIWHKHLDVTRLLLSRKASQDHINARGWNTVFFCWSWVRPGEPEMLGFLNLLAEEDMMDLDIADLQGWTVLDRVAACGTAREVRRLIELGADPHQAAKPLNWTCLHQAVYRGNFETYLELLSEFEKVSSIKDTRGWTLLHIAASAGHTRIVEHLLHTGADPDAHSYIVDDAELLSRIPENIHGLQCTPQEVAAAQSSEREEIFIAALAKHRSMKPEIREEQDTFWAAQEHLEDGFLQGQGHK